MPEAISSAPNTPLVGIVLRERWAAVFDAAQQAAGTFSVAEGGLRPDLLKVVRKATKTGRALLPLIASGVRNESLSGAERAFADAAHLLSPIRDRDALLKTVERLFLGKDDERARHVHDLLAAVITASERSPVEDRSFEHASVDRAMIAMTRAEAVISTVDWSAVSATAIGAVVGDAWKAARRRANREWNLDGEAPHELRKECSRIVQHLLLLDDSLPKSTRRFRQQLRRVTSSLGDEHDLAMLGERMSMERDRLGNGSFVDAALALCRKARLRLREQAGHSLVEAMTIRPRELARSITSS